MESSKPPPVIYACRVIKPHSHFQVGDAYRERQRRNPGWKSEWDDDSPFWPVNVGDIGWCRDPKIDLVENEGYAYISLLRNNGYGLVTLYLNYKNKGYVPASCIEIGKPRANVLYVNPRSIVPNIESLFGPGSIPGDKFSTFTAALYKNLGAQKNTLIGLGCSTEYIDWMSLGNLTPWLEKGMRNAGTRQIFAHHAPTLDQLWALGGIAPRSHSPDFLQSNPGIYAILYRLRVPHHTQKEWWYIGHSNDIGHRFYNHKSIIDGKYPIVWSREHYVPGHEVAKDKNGAYRCIALATWDPTEITNIMSKLLTCTEQILQCSLHSMSKRVLSLPNIGQYVAHGQDYSLASFLSNLTSKVAEASGWDLNKTVQGMNFSMPLAEIARSESPQFIQYDVLDAMGQVAMSTFHRRPIRIRYSAKGHGRVSILPEGLKWDILDGQRKQTLTRPRLRVPVPDQWSIPPQTKVNIIVEIVREGQVHHTPYFTMPTVGAFSNYADILRVALRCEWEVDGTCKSGWFQASTRADKMVLKPNHTGNPYFGYQATPHLNLAYRRVLELLTSLKQYQYMPKPPTWMALPAKLPIIQASRNHLEQRYDLSRPQPIQMEAPRLMSVQDNKRRLANLFGKGIAIGNMPEKFRKNQTHSDGRGARKSCDTCTLRLVDHQTITTQDHSRCELTVVDGEQTCTNCVRSRMPCTWHLASEILDLGFQDLIPRKKLDGTSSVKFIPRLSLGPSAGEIKDGDEDEDEDEDEDGGDEDDSEDED